MRALLPLVACLALGACLTSPKECVDNPSNPATEQFAASLGVDISSMSKTQLGDYTQDITGGTGATLTDPGPVTIHYSAYLSNGTLVDQVDQDFSIDLRSQSTIGLADGMLGMQVGGERLIVAPSDNALGPCDQGNIPGNSTIVYKVDLITIGS